MPWAWWAFGKVNQCHEENLEAMQKMGIKIPVILKIGAALTDSFVEDFCRPIYDGPIYYCKDAFEGIQAMSRIEAKDYNTDFGHVTPENSITKAQKEAKEMPPFEAIKMPSRDIKIPTPPFWGRRVLKTDVKELDFMDQPQNPLLPTMGIQWQRAE